MEQFEPRPTPGVGRPGFGPGPAMHRDPGVRWLRYVIVGLTLVLGLALLSRGSVLIGGLVTVLAVLRIVMVTKIERRRRAFQAGRRSAPFA